MEISSEIHRKTPLGRKAEAVVRRLQEAGHEAYFVGGCVRDLVMGRVPEDYDITTGALPDQVQNLFERSVSVGAKFGVVLVACYTNRSRGALSTMSAA